MVIDPGNHNCEKPDPGRDACKVLDRNGGDVWWRCPECRSGWRGVPAYSEVKDEGWRYRLSWRRTSESSHKWRKAERRRIERMVTNDA